MKLNLIALARGGYLIEGANGGDADIEGSAEEMRALANAIRHRSTVTFRRCAVAVSSSGVRFWSPRNSQLPPRFIPHADALDLAKQIEQRLGPRGHGHLVGDEFQSDKYPTCPAGKVPLSTKDPMAQDLLWQYAQRRRAVDADFSADLEEALRLKGYRPAERELTIGVKSSAAMQTAPYGYLIVWLELSDDFVLEAELNPYTKFRFRSCSLRRRRSGGDGVYLASWELPDGYEATRMPWREIEEWFAAWQAATWPGKKVALELSEEHRQAVLLALAHLAVERPGWDDMLSRIALQIDNKNGQGRPTMYDYFRKLHRES